MTITKKIFAGVLAAASVLSLSTSAFAVAAPDKTKAVTKPGEVEYDAGVTAMQAELDVELPAQMKAFINPYGAEVAVNEDATPTKAKCGVLSWAYEVVNNTEDFGIMIDVKNGKATVPTGVTLAAPAVANTFNDKKIGIALAAGATAAEIYPAAWAPITASKKASYTDGVLAGGAFVFTAAETSQSKFAYAPAKTAASSGKVYIGFNGIVGTKYAAADAGAGIAAGDAVDWSEVEVSCTYILKINPAAKTAAAADFS